PSRSPPSPSAAATCWGSRPGRTRRPGWPRVLSVATWNDVRRIALAMPETTEQPSRGFPQWRVKGTGVCWGRPPRRAHGRGRRAGPDGPILAARVADLGVKEALLASDPAVFFTTPHFNGYPAVLVRLDRIAVAELDELISEAWVTTAPKRLARDYLQQPR